MSEEELALGLSLFKEGSTIDEVRRVWLCGRNKAIKILKENLGFELYVEIARATKIKRFTSAAARSNLGSVRGPMSGKVKEKISKANTGKTRDEATRLKISLGMKERIAQHGPLRTKESYISGASLARETKIANGVYEEFSRKMTGKRKAPHSNEAKRKMSFSRKRFLINGGSVWIKGRKHSNESRALISRATKSQWENGAFDLKNGVWRSKLEMSVFDEISFQHVCQHSHRISSKVYDIFVMDFNLLIEVNGDYWHLNPSIYSSDYFDEHRGITAAEIWIRDQEKLELARSRGYNVEVIWQSDLITDFHGAIKHALSRYQGGDHQKEACASN